MTILCCGSRNWSKWTTMNRTLYLLRDIAGFYKMLHGGAPGADQVAGAIADYYGWEVEVMRPDWFKYGKRAGMLRNTEMLERRPDYVIAFWDGVSRGTLDTITKAVNVYRIPTMVIREGR